jgi:putative thioredoxin
MSVTSPWILETTAERFQQDVIERSMDVPVVVDFWADWCQPCRLLGPVLERLANEFAGRFVLVKANTDELFEIAASFQVTGIPAVFGLRDGEVVDQFVGLLSEHQIRVWLEGLLPDAAETLAAEARRLEAADPQAAEARYREALEQAPSATHARVGLARTLLSQQRLDEARAMIDDLAAAGLLDSEGEQVQAELVLQWEAQRAGSLESCRAAAEAAPDDPSAQLQLAKALAGARQYPEAMDVCLAVVGRDRHGLGEKARELMVYIFHVLGPESELAGDYRRKLTMALY